MNIGGIGSFAGGLAGGFQEAENAAASRAYTKARTAETESTTEGVRQHREALKEYGEKLKDWDASGRSGPAPIAPAGVQDAYAPIPSVSAKPAPGGEAPQAPGAMAMPARAQVAQMLKQSGFHALAQGVAGDQPDSAPMLTQPAPNAAGMGLSQPAAPIPNLSQLTAQAAGPSSGLMKPLYDKTQVFGGA